VAVRAHYDKVDTLFIYNFCDLGRRTAKANGGLCFIAEVG
jgi:hypothetical protein